MKDKKSFIAYCDWMEVFDALPDEQAGKLIKHLFAYVNDLDPKTDDPIVKLTFIPIKQSLKRDLSKYETYIQKQRNNGAKGGRPPKMEKPKEPTGLLENPTEPKKADSVSVNVSVSDTVNVNDNVTKTHSELKDLPTRINYFTHSVTEVNTINNLLDFIELQKFVDYWTEHGEKDKKARWEKEKVFDTKKRLVRWANSNKSKSGNNGESRQEQFQRTHDELDRISSLSQGNDQQPPESA